MTSIERATSNALSAVALTVALAACAAPDARAAKDCSICTPLANPP
jgi:hypothetical protein